MKKFFVIIVTSISLISCSKQVATPHGATSQNVFFQSAGIMVEDMAAKPTAPDNVLISFSAVFEKNISRVELMSSASPNTFCTAQVIDVTGNSSAKKTYSFSDANVKGNTMYYLLRFKNNDGDWVYSSYVTVKLG